MGYASCRCWHLHHCLNMTPGPAPAYTFLCRCGVGKYLHLGMAVLGTAWWAACAAVVQKGVSDAANDGLPLQGWRSAASIMLWVQTGLFGGLALTSLAWVCSSGRGGKYESMA